MKNLSGKFKRKALKAGMSETESNIIIIEIFETCYNLGLKKEDVNGMFLALEQMVTKGRISSEDLRRKLGSRIPGVMNIMADAIGIPITELDEMIRNGDVISCNVLPEFIAKMNIVMSHQNKNY